MNPFALYQPYIAKLARPTQEAEHQEHRHMVDDEIQALLDRRAKALCELRSMQRHQKRKLRLLQWLLVVLWAGLLWSIF